MCRRVPERIVIAYFNDKVIANVNAGIATCAGSNSEGSANRLSDVHQGYQLGCRLSEASLQ